MTPLLWLALFVYNSRNLSLHTKTCFLLYQRWYALSLGRKYFTMSETNGTSTTKQALNSRSKTITEGAVRAPNRSMLRAVGLTDEDFNKPLIGIASTWSGQPIEPRPPGLSSDPVPMEAESRAGIERCIHLQTKAHRTRG